MGLRCARLTFYGEHDWLFIYGKIEETIEQTASDNALKMNCKNRILTFIEFCAYLFI